MGSATFRMGTPADLSARANYALTLEIGQIVRQPR
jgi:hypothetical protein